MRFLGVFAALLTLVVSVVAQGPSVPPSSGPPGPPRPQMPPRDVSTQPVPTGTAGIRGRVVAADGRGPLRRAQVRVSSPEARTSRATNTDAEGRYEFAELPAGRYTISVSRTGYVSLSYGQQRPFEPGRPLDIANGQVIERVDFALPRGGVIAGRITDETGEPMAGVSMMAMRYQYLPGGERELLPAGGGPFSMMTNDLGEFRVFGLMPGTYVLSATTRQGFIITSSGGPNVASPAENEGHGTTYYPGTLNPDEAQPITVGIAQEASASFALAPTRMTTISGIVRDSSGKPLTGLPLTVRTATRGMMSFANGTAIGPDGRFRLTQVPPGDHFLEVYPRSSRDGEFGSVRVTAGGGDIHDLIISTSPGATISGRVTFEGTSSAPKPGRIVANSPDPRMLPRMFNDSGDIDEAGRFQIKSGPGQVLFAATSTGFGMPAQGWVIKSVTFNGVDITDTPLDVPASAEFSGIEIVITDKLTNVSGAVKNSRGEQVRDYTVVIFPDRLIEGSIAQRYTRLARPDQQGRFETRGLPAGDYLAAAVESLEQGGQWDPAFRKQVEPAAKRFTLTEGQTVTIDLQLQ